MKSGGFGDMEYLDEMKFVDNETELNHLINSSWNKRNKVDSSLSNQRC